MSVYIKTIETDLQCSGIENQHTKKRRMLHRKINILLTECSKQ